MDWLNLFLSGLGGGILTAGVSLYMHNSTRPKSSGQAYTLLKKLQFLLKQERSEYYFAKSIDENYHIAKSIYINADAEIIATSFNEDPVKYGEGDVARGYRYSSLFTRITSDDICSPESQKKCRKVMGKILQGSKFIVIPRNERITRIDGIFCRFKDSSYLCAISFRNPTSIDKNRGVVFRDGIAEGFFEYYKSLVDNYTQQTPEATIAHADIA